MTKKVVIVCIWISLLISSFSPLISAQEEIKITTNVIVNVREGPSLEEAIVGKLEIGKEYTVVQETDGWIEIKLENAMNGWVAAYLVTKNTNAPLTKTSFQEEDRATILEDGLRLRMGPGTSYQVISTLRKGTEVTIISIDSDWINVLTSEGKGWVHEDYLETSHRTEETSAISSSIQETELDVSNVKSAIILEDQINVRNEPSTSSDIIGKVAKNTVIHVLEEQGDWAKIQYSGNSGWIYKNLLRYEHTEAEIGTKINKTISIIYNQSNIRSSASSSAPVIQQASAGETFQAVELLNDWFKIEISKGEYGYIADWIVKEVDQEIQLTDESGSSDLTNKIIVLDPGHGGKDSGAIGALGNLEKNLTINTAHLLGEKLEAAGAKVIYTRTDDTFVTLQNRVAISQSYKADAFISIHYDSIEDSSVHGITSYYYSSTQKKLATSIHKSIMDSSGLKDRGVKQNDYFVLRENSQAASLLELGYLSNPSEEQVISNAQYQETISTAIYQGLENYFNVP